MRTTTKGSGMQFMIILMCHWKNAGFSKQGHNSLIKGCRQWEEITLSPCITYHGFKYEKLSHEERRLNLASDEKGRIKISILSFVIDSLSGRASLFAQSLHANEACCAVLSYVSSQGKGSLITADAAEGKAKEKASRAREGFWIEHCFGLNRKRKATQTTVLRQTRKIKTWALVLLF